MWACAGAPATAATADLDRLRIPLPEAELQARFEALQRKLIPQWELIEAFTDEPYTMVVVPSLSGVDLPLDSTKRQAYEERYLFLLFLLRQPRAKVIYVTSEGDSADPHRLLRRPTSGRRRQSRPGAAPLLEPA